MNEHVLLWYSSDSDSSQRAATSPARGRGGRTSGRGFRRGSSVRAPPAPNSAPRPSAAPAPRPSAPPSTLPAPNSAPRPSAPPSAPPRDNCLRPSVITSRGRAPPRCPRFHDYDSDGLMKDESGRALPGDYGFEGYNIEERSDSDAGE
ncbi:classical arabinogalactan protein 10-like [Lotus japonicus]|uniref:classical arabinogalactan protein 10-like n=1 Tax=Lotus japonicus TaxID=34305 RepID=UPI0025866A18|nr:classical arabinogalactan protein 10-like [Lotus japonicus]